MALRCPPEHKRLEPLPAWGQRIRKQRIPAKPNYDRAAPHFYDDKNVGVHMIIAGMGYSKTRNELSSGRDARNVCEFANHCVLHSLEFLQDTKCSPQALLSAVAASAARCGPDDYFVFFFAGHGANVAEVTNDPADEGREAFVCVSQNGQMTRETFVTGDEFSQSVLQNCNALTRVVIITDCCHTGPVVDVTGQTWAGRQVVTISGCRDFRTTRDMSLGGIFTQEFLLALDKLAKVGLEDYSVAVLWNAIVHEDLIVFSGIQEMIVQSSLGFSPDQMAWPLVSMGFDAPLNRMRLTGKKSVDVEMLQGLGLDPLLVTRVHTEHLRQPVSVEAYTEYVQASDVRSDRVCRVCFNGVGSQCSLQ